MPTARKQPSGMWKCRVYSHTTPDGKKHYRAFTASTKQEAETLAAQFSGTEERAERVDLTVSEAIERYITAKEGVLSPSTIRGYRRMARNNFDGIARQKIRRLTSERVQLWISDLSQTMSPKSVKNIYALLTSSVALYLPEKSFRVKLPTRQKKRTHAPTDAQVMALYNAAPEWLKICIGLGAFCGLRRGEISALKYGDIDGNVIHIHADMIQDSAGKYHYKPMPKTTDSVREVYAPAELISLIGDGDPDNFIIDRYTGSITAQFETLRDSLGFNEIRFHDLRAYYASTGALLIPDIFLARFGGWGKSSETMKNLYQREQDGMAELFAGKMTDHFSGMIQNMT